MKVSFANQRPSGAYALAIPVWGEDMLADRLAGLDEAARARRPRRRRPALRARGGDDRRDLRRGGRRAPAGCC